MNHPSLRKGFTLIEMLITLAILGVVSAIAIPAYNGYIKTAKMSEAHNNLAALRLAEEEYFLDNNGYFQGGDWTTLESASDNLWKRTKGNDGYNFDYVVTLSSGWTAIATGTTGSVLNETVTINK